MTLETRKRIELWIKHITEIHDQIELVHEEENDLANESDNSDSNADNLDSGMCHLRDAIDELDAVLKRMA